MSELLLSIGFGLVVTSVVALSADGLSLQFCTTNYINFASAELGFPPKATAHDEGQS